MAEIWSYSNIKRALKYFRLLFYFTLRPLTLKVCMERIMGFVYTNVHTNVIIIDDFKICVSNLKDDSISFDVCTYNAKTTLENTHLVIKWLENVYITLTDIFQIRIMQTRC